MNTKISLSHSLTFSLASTLAGLFLALSPASARNPDVSTRTINLSESAATTAPRLDDTVPEVAAGSNNVVHSAWLRGGSGNYALCYRRSIDGGTTWEATRVLLPSTAAAKITRSSGEEMRMVVSGNVVHVAVVYNYPSSATRNWYHSIIYTRSLDGGRTFSPLRKIYDSGDIWHIYNVKLHAAGTTFTVALNRSLNYVENQQFQLLMSSDNGATFTIRTAFSHSSGSPTRYGAWQIVDYNRSGNTHCIIYTDSEWYYGMVYRRMYAAVSTNNGATFLSRLLSVPSKNGQHKALSSNDSNQALRPKIAIDGQSVGFVFGSLDALDVPHLYYRRTLDGGRSWSLLKLTASGLPTGVQIGENSQTMAAAHGKVYVAMQGTDGKIYFRQSADAGVSFTPWKCLTPSGEAHISGGNFPAILIEKRDTTGKSAQIYIAAWGERRNGCWVRTADGGATFTAPIPISPYRSWWTNPSQTLAILDGADRLHVVTRGQFYVTPAAVPEVDADIFYRRLTPSPAWNRALNVALDLRGQYNSVGQYDHMVAPDGPANRIASAFTIEAWVRWDDLHSQSGKFIIASKSHDSSPSWAGVQLAMNRSNLYVRVLTNISSGGWYDDTWSVYGPPVPANRWTHVACTYNPAATTDSLKLFINGTVVAKRQAQGIPVHVNGLLYLGLPFEYNNSDAATNHLLMDEVRIWNVERTQSQIITTMRMKLTGTELNLMTYYPFDGSTTRNVTGKGSDGMLNYRERFSAVVPFP